jgi:hypothetical protein
VRWRFQCGKITANRRKRVWKFSFSRLICEWSEKILFKELWEQRNSIKRQDIPRNSELRGIRTKHLTKTEAYRCRPGTRAWINNAVIGRSAMISGPNREPVRTARISPRRDISIRRSDPSTLKYSDVLR